MGRPVSRRVRAVAIGGLALSFAGAGCRPSADESGPPAKSPYEHADRAIASADLDVLEHADTLTVLRIDGNAVNATDEVQGYPVTSRAVVTSASARRAIVDAVAKTIDNQDKFYVYCFNPHHAISATKGNKTVDLIICFECSRLHVYGQRPSSISISGKDGARFDQLFAEAGAR